MHWGFDGLGEVRTLLKFIVKKHSVKVRALFNWRSAAGKQYSPVFAACVIVISFLTSRF